MPYTAKKQKSKTCIYKKDSGKKVGCTKGPVKKYLAALHANVKESLSFKQVFESAGDGIWTRIGANEWIVELSTLEVNGYKFPESLKVPQKVVNVKMFKPVRDGTTDNEVMHWEYITKQGKRFIVLND